MTFTRATSAAEVSRRDLARQVTVDTNLDGLPLGTAGTKVNEAVQKIKDLYKSKGYYNTDVISKINSPPAGNAEVRFEVKEGKKITILGSAFKENTDDIRESTSIVLINTLLRHGCRIIVHDPKALKNTYSIFKNRVSYTERLTEGLRNSNCAVIMTPWDEYKKLGEKDFLLMKSPIVIDTRRILKIKSKKIKYTGLGIGE